MTKKKDEEKEFETSPTEPESVLYLTPDVFAQILRHVSSWRDVVAAAGTCRSWRKATQDFLRNSNGPYPRNEYFEAFTWSDWQTLNEATRASKTGIESSSNPLMEDNCPQPAHKRFAGLDCSSGESPGNAYPTSFELSPKTPSPDKTILVEKPRETLLGKVIPQLQAVGYLLSSINIKSFSLDDAKMQSILKSCPSLRELSLTHACAERVSRSIRGLGTLELSEASPIRIASSVSEKNRGRHVQSTKCIEPCGCAVLTGAGFKNLSQWCAYLEKMDLTFEHICHPNALTAILEALAHQMYNMKALAIRLVEPEELKFQSLKNHYEWHKLSFFTQEQLLLLAEGNGHKHHLLEHLSLEPWSATEESLQFCSIAFPNLKCLKVSNPVVCQLDGTQSGGIQSCPSLSQFQKLESLYLSKVLRVEDVSSVFSSTSVNELELELECNLEDWQLNELRQSCSDISHVVLSYFKENLRVQCEWGGEG